MKNLEQKEFTEFYNYYINLNPHDSLIEGLKEQLVATVDFFKQIPVEKLNYKYQIGKWTPKDILQHLIDTERIFSYRALCFARKDKTCLPGYEENDYALNVDTSTRTIESLLEEYKSVKKASITLFENLAEESLVQIGTANNAHMSVRAIGFMIPGHELHHIKVIKERYL